jgi:hypothetical protein
MTSTVELTPVSGPAAWRGDELSKTGEWIYHLSDAERQELEEAGRRFVADDPDLRTVTAADYPLPACAGLNAESARQMDSGRGFVLVRGLRTDEYGDEFAAAIFFVMGLHLGQPIGQDQMGNLLGHVIATSDKSHDDPTALGSRIRDRLPFHSDTSDVVGLICLRPSKEGGASSLVSGATIYNEILWRRPDLAPLLSERFHWDWRRQDPDSPELTYDSPAISYVDGTFSAYAGSTMVFSAQEYPGVPKITDAQAEVLNLWDEISQEPGLAIDMDFRPGDVQWLLNYAALHSRTRFTDYPEPERRRHLLRLWLKRDVGRPLVERFGKHVVALGDPSAVRKPGGRFRVGEAVIVDEDWGKGGHRP